MSLECACVHHNNGRCKKFSDDKYTSWCNAEGLCEHREPSNADRIREMSDEELGIFLGEWADNPLSWKRDGEGECLAWLQEPAKEEE